MGEEKFLSSITLDSQNYRESVSNFSRYSTSRCYEVQEPHPQPPPILKVYPFPPPAAGGLRGVRGGGLRCTSLKPNLLYLAHYL